MPVLSFSGLSVGLFYTFFYSFDLSRFILQWFGLHVNLVCYPLPSPFVSVTVELLSCRTASQEEVELSGPYKWSHL